MLVAVARQGKSKQGRVTPKGTPSGSGRSGVSREPVKVKESSPLVPIAMFAMLGGGILLIFVNYLFESLGSNALLFAGLGLILGGIVTATRYQ